MKIGRGPTEEERAWAELVAAWDRSINRLKTQIDRGTDREREENDDERR